MAEALTLKANGIARVLMSDIGISFPVGNVQPAEIKVFKGIWDTGATGCVITSKVVADLGLKPTGMREVHTANGKANQQTYLVDIYLPNQVRVVNLTVTEALLPPDTDCLIGMDVITLGDFCITNLDGRTTMSFRTPSSITIDFVEELKNRDPNKLNRQQRRALERKNKI
jgi:predicted aspartyl protease